MISSKNKPNKYHHGDLYESLLSTATKMISEEGVEALSLRKLAEKIGVSRTAAYHHFKDKNHLLSVIAAEGFTTWQKKSEQIFTNTILSNREKYRTFVHQYVHFATDNPALYDLMFGSTLWKNTPLDEESTKTLRDVAYPSFQYQLEMTNIWQKNNLLPNSVNTLRLAQVTWATLHGIARLLIDGIYADVGHIDEMCECVVNLFLSSSSE